MQDPGFVRGDFERSLVGLEFEEDLVELNGVAVFLEPAGNVPLGDGFAGGWDDDVNAHAESPDWAFEKWEGEWRRVRAPRMLR